MDVYLIPVGLSRHELYCEVAEEPHERPDEKPHRSGVVRRMWTRFRAVVAAAENRAPPSANLPDRDERGWARRLRQQLLRWVAEKIAEQRLLWHLRRQRDATLVYPEDMHEADAIRILRGALGRDFVRHRRWLVIDALGLLVSGVLVLVPGPNALAYYFAFRVVGHYLSMRGARQGLSSVTWLARPSTPLRELRRAAALAPPLREREVQNIASELQLQHLPRFFDRTVVTP